MFPNSNNIDKLSTDQKTVIGLISLLLFTIVVDYMTLPALSAILLRELQITTIQFGLLVSVYSFSAGISGILAIGFADSFDRKQLLLFYFGGFLLGLLLCAASSSITVLIFARVVTGAFGGVVASICFAMIADQFAVNQRGRAMGFIQMAFAGSHIAGLPFTLYLATHFHWNLAYWMLFSIGMTTWLCAYIMLKPFKTHLELPREPTPLRHALHILRSRQYWTVFFNNILLVCGDVMFMTFGSGYTTNNLGVNLDDLPLLFGIGGVATILFSPTIGQVADRYGKLPIFSLGTVLAIVSVAAYSHLGIVQFWMVALLHTFLLICINTRMITSSALATVVPSEQDRGAFMALDASAQQVASGVAASIAGLIVNQKSNGMIQGYSSLGWVVITLMLMTLALMFMINQIVKEQRP